MAKKGKQDRPNPFLKKERDTLLNDLDQVQNLLGDDGDDVPTLKPEPDDSAPAEEQIPLLGEQEPAKPAGGTASARKSAETGKPPAARGPSPEKKAPAGETAPDTGTDSLREQLRQRKNPFLSSDHLEELRSQRSRAEKNLDSLFEETSRGSAKENPATPAPKPGNETPAAGATRPDEKQIRAAVDEILAEWMPKLERELRERLTRKLRGEE